jgi:hypothetical protein
MRLTLFVLLVSLAGCKTSAPPTTQNLPPVAPAAPDLAPLPDAGIRTPDLPVAPDMGIRTPDLPPLPDQTESTPTPAAPPPAKVRKVSGTALWDSLLKRHCKGGRLDYAGIHAKDRQALASFASWVGRRAPSGSKQTRLAFYLNAYNALVVKALVDRWPQPGGVMKVPGFFKKIRHRVGGKSVTLDQLENKIIRPTFKEPRIHFALVCGARGCPPLRCRAFYGGGLDRVLEGLARRFINGRLGVREEDGKLRVSKLFSWYAGDFKAAAGSVGKYLAGYHRKLGQRLSEATDLSYLPYSWALNNR